MVGLSHLSDDKISFIYCFIKSFWTRIDSLIARQITVRIVHLRIQAPKLVHIHIRCCSFDLSVWPNENPRWRPFFKMAAIEYTIILHSAIKSYKLVLFVWSWCQIIHFSLCRIQICTHGLTDWLPCTIYHTIKWYVMQTSNHF